MTPPFVVCGKTSFTQLEDDRYRNCGAARRADVVRITDRERCKVWKQQKNREFYLVSQKAIFLSLIHIPHLIVKI